MYCVGFYQTLIVTYVITLKARCFAVYASVNGMWQLILNHAYLGTSESLQTEIKVFL